MNMLAQFSENQKTMSSREIAELCEKRHDHACRDIVNLNATYEGMGFPKIGDGYYTHPNTGSQQHREFLLSKEQSIDLVTGYNSELRIKINRRWAELENQSVVNLPDYPTALRLYADQLEVSARLELERNHAIATKAEIGSRREATAMGRLSAKVKEVESLKVQLDKSLDFASIKAVEIATGRKFGWHQLKKWSKANSSEIKTIPDPNFGEVKTYHKDAWLAVYNINLSSIRGVAA